MLSENHYAWGFFFLSCSGVFFSGPSFPPVWLSAHVQYVLRPAGWNPAGRSRWPLRKISLLRTFTTRRTGSRAHGGSCCHSLSGGCLVSLLLRLSTRLFARIHTPAGPTWWVRHGLVGKPIKSVGNRRQNRVGDWTDSVSRSSKPTKVLFSVLAFNSSIIHGEKRMETQLKIVKI